MHICRCFLLLSALLLTALLPGPGACAAPATQVAAQPVAQPAVSSDARSVYCPTPPSAFTLYAFAPELLAAWNTPLRDYEKKFIPAQYHNLPVLGGWYGQGFIPDREMLLASGIKKAFYLSMGMHDRLPIVQTLSSLGMQVDSAPGASMKDMAACFLTMGRLYDRAERGKALAAYADTALNKVAAAMNNLPAEQRTRVYVALEANGLATVCRGSVRSEVLEAAGAESVHMCPPGTENAQLKVTFEQVMAYKPDVVLVFHPELMRRIHSDPLWSSLPAVQAGRVYFIPRGPFSWIERPASYMRLIGVQWLANLLHPDLFSLDIKAESRQFMKLFFNLNLNDAQVNELFEPYGTF